jgi:hypothetical protein
MPGAREALRTYVERNKSIRMIELANSQCLVIKM